MVLGLTFQKPCYLILQQEDKSESPKTHKKIPSSTTIPLWLLSILLAVALGYVLGFYHQKSGSLGPVRIPGDSQTIFAYNRTFAEAPSPLSDGAWNNIFPVNGGFFQHPKFAPQRSGLAVFHQLHCLDNIRRGYWSVTYKAESETLEEHSDNHRQITPAHVRHCIDYLRQSLMCHADTNIEPIEESLGGVRGFGVEHHCRNFDSVMSWITEWETTDVH